MQTANFSAHNNPVQSNSGGSHYNGKVNNRNNMSRSGNNPRKNLGGSNKKKQQQDQHQVQHSAPQGTQNSNSWSSVVKQQSYRPVQTEPTTAPVQNPAAPPTNTNTNTQAQAAVNQSGHQNTNTHNKQGKGHQNQKSGHHYRPAVVADVHEEAYDADAKINQIQIAVQSQLSAMEMKTEKLKGLQEAIKAIKADGDGQIEQLVEERKRLIQKLAQLKDEIELKDKRVSEIDREVESLKKENVQRIRSLEEECRALLGN